MAQPRVLITHDFAEVYGGAERVTEVLAAEFPDAEVWAILGTESVAQRMGVADRFHSLLPPRKRLRHHFRLLSPVLPLIIDNVRLPDADVILSSSYAFAHHFRTANAAPQVCYCHSPLRFAWSMTSDYNEEWTGNRATAVAFNAFAAGMRTVDRRAAQRVDLYLTQSPYTGEQIQRFYGKTPRVVGAPIDGSVFRPGPQSEVEDYFLICGRLIEPYKRVGVAIDAFRRLGRRLIVAGDGPALAELKRDAPANVTFTGHLDDASVVELMQRASALLFPSRDDFGLVPVEAMACGRPVLAFRGGGAQYTVVDGQTGAFFEEQTADAIERAVRAFDPGAYDSAAIRKHAEQWDTPQFRARIRAAVEQVAGPGFTSAPTPSPAKPTLA